MLSTFRPPFSYAITALPIVAITALAFEKQLLAPWVNAHLKIDFIVNFVFLNAFHIIAGLTLLTLPSVRKWYFFGKRSAELKTIGLTVIAVSALLIAALVASLGSRDLYLPLFALSQGLTTTHAVLQSHGLSRQLNFALAPRGHSTDETENRADRLHRIEAFAAHGLALAVFFLTLVKVYRFYGIAGAGPLEPLFPLLSSLIVACVIVLTGLPLFHATNLRWPKLVFNLRFILYAFTPWSFFAFALNRAIHASEYLGVIDNAIRHQRSSMQSSDHLRFWGWTIGLTAIAFFSYWPWDFWPWAVPSSQAKFDLPSSSTLALSASYLALWLSFIHIGMDTVLYRRWSGGIQVLGPIISGQQIDVNSAK